MQFNPSLGLLRKAITKRQSDVWRTISATSDQALTLYTSFTRGGFMMNLLINESPLQVLPSLAIQVGLTEAILLQQLHFRSLISNNTRDGH